MIILISTKDLSCMPNIDDLRRICKGISALEIIMSAQWDMRYYSYNPDWEDDEEAFEMRDGGEQHMLILFSPAGCVISGVDGDFYDWESDTPKTEDLTRGLPDAFHEFMYGEPVKSLKSTFCIWTTDGAEWSSGNTEDMAADGSQDMLSILDGAPKRYAEFCAWYYEKNIPLDIVEKVYGGETLTLEMIKCLNRERNDIAAIKAELCEIGYPNTL